MQNLIMNSQWAPGPGGGPQYFSGFGPITYDRLSIGGYRTCSITNMGPMMAQDFYDPMIDVKGRPAISWGFTIRTVDADYIALVAAFYDANMGMLSAVESPVTGEVGYDFKQVLSKFTVPAGAEKVRLSIKFAGKVTACTYYAPVAYYA
jgi:hypothetical protein